MLDEQVLHVEVFLVVHQLLSMPMDDAIVLVHLEKMDFLCLKKIQLDIFFFLVFNYLSSNNVVYILCCISTIKFKLSYVNSIELNFLSSRIVV